MMSIHVLTSQWCCGLVDQFVGRMSFVQAGYGRKQNQYVEKQAGNVCPFWMAPHIPFCKWLNILAEIQSVAEITELCWAAGEEAALEKSMHSSPEKHCFLETFL